ncbi:hypothetical protein DFH27DRAFT_135636 [Peziza echinospora]|nr:hypothetical protein DFH27DRAFT_135636 [Peziza echinospora]
MSGFEIKSIVGMSSPSRNGHGKQPGSSCCSPTGTASKEIPGRRLATATRAKFFEDLSSPEGQKSFPIPNATAYAGLSSIYHEEAEMDILSRQSKELVSMICPRTTVIVEFLGGQSSMAANILAEIERLGTPFKYYAVSSSSMDCLKAFSLLGPWKYKNVQLIGLHGSYEDACDWLAVNEAGSAKTILWLSHSIASFDRIDVAIFLRRLTAHLLLPGDLVIIGTERRGTERDVFECGGGGESNKNRLMDNLRRSYGLYFESARETFSSDLWELDDEYDATIGARRCYIVAKKNLKLNNDITVNAGERVLMEQSWKYDDGDIQEMLRYTGLDLTTAYTDSEGAYDLRVLTLPQCKTPKQFCTLKAYFDQKEG